MQGLSFNVKRVDSKLDLDELAVGSMERLNLLCAGSSISLIKSLPQLPISASFGSLPMELHMEIINRITQQKDLLALRAVNRYTRRLVDVVLRERFSIAIADSEAALKRSESSLEEANSVHQPIMAHCQSFIRRASCRTLTELVHHSNPVNELQSVCACLCLLLGVDTSNVRNYSGPYTSDRIATDNCGTAPSHFAKIDVNGDLRWAEIKRAMSKPQFKSWYVELSNNVNSIPMEFVEYVENVIRADPNISYERLAVVSSVAHELLVVISACLHHVRSFQACKVHEDAISEIKIKAQRHATFHSFLSR